MARHLKKWDGAWRSVTWASARGLWKKPSAEEEAEDAEFWRRATCEDGGFAAVFWCELRQLVGDLLPSHLRDELRRRVDR